MIQSLPYHVAQIHPTHDDCEVALAALVDTGLLIRRGDQYVRTITGELPQLARRGVAAPTVPVAVRP